MRVLVACEFSGIVRDAFAARGHDAWSCDLLPTEVPGKHIEGDILPVLGDGWDLMIAHPPCTYLTRAGERWFALDAARGPKRETAIAFVRSLWNAPIPRVCVENPKGVLTQRFRRESQTIQPWEFGHGETKRTCLWLRGLPPLMATSIKSGRDQRLHRLPPSLDRWKLRSRTFHGIAVAMADQWGRLSLRTHPPAGAAIHDAGTET